MIDYRSTETSVLFFSQYIDGSFWGFYVALMIFQSYFDLEEGDTQVGSLGFVESSPGPNCNDLQAKSLTNEALDHHRSVLSQFRSSDMQTVISCSPSSAVNISAII